MTNSKFTLFFSLLMCVCVSSYGCPDTGSMNFTDIKDCTLFEAPSDSLADNEGTIFDVVDEMPVFEGGINGLIEFLSNNITYPKSAEEKRIEGRVIVKFCVERDGSIGDVILLKSLCQECDAEAVRVVKAMPKWKPGMKDGRAVRVWFTLPVTYVLPEEDPNGGSNGAQGSCNGN